MRRMRLKTYSNSQRAQGGKGLLSHVNSVDESHKSMAKILPRREEGGRTWRKKRGGAPGCVFLCVQELILLHVLGPSYL